MSKLSERLAPKFAGLVHNQDDGEYIVSEVLKAAEEALDEFALRIEVRDKILYAIDHDVTMGLLSRDLIDLVVKRILHGE